MITAFEALKKVCLQSSPWTDAELIKSRNTDAITFANFVAAKYMGDEFSEEAKTEVKNYKKNTYYLKLVNDAVYKGFKPMRPIKEDIRITIEDIRGKEYETTILLYEIK